MYAGECVEVISRLLPAGNHDYTVPAIKILYFLMLWRLVPEY